jgi:hypothetical protein
MSVLDIVTEADAYSRLPIAGYLYPAAAPGEHRERRGRCSMARSAAKTRNPVVNASRFSDLRALANFPFKRARCVRSTVPAVDDHFGRLATERVRDIRARWRIEFVYRIRDRIPLHV